MCIVRTDLCWSIIFVYKDLSYDTISFYFFRHANSFQSYFGSLNALIWCVFQKYSICKVLCRVWYVYVIYQLVFFSKLPLRWFSSDWAWRPRRNAHIVSVSRYPGRYVEVQLWHSMGRPIPKGHRRGFVIRSRLWVPFLQRSSFPSWLFPLHTSLLCKAIPRLGARYVSRISFSKL